MNVKKTNRRWRYAMLAMAMAMAAAAACTETNDKQNHPTGPRQIGFDLGWQAGRAYEFTNENLNRIGVFAYSHPAYNYPWDFSGSTPDYFCNKMVVKLSEDQHAAWWYDGPTKYWPDKNQTWLTFFAYAPYIDVHDIFTLDPMNEQNAGSPFIEYTPPADAIRQIDLLWDMQANRRYDPGSQDNWEPTVRFEMKHALTSILFEAAIKKDENHKNAPYTVEVLSVGVRNAVKSGTFHLDGGGWYLPGPPELTDYTLTAEEHKGLETVIFHCQYDYQEKPNEYTDPAKGFKLLNKSYGTLMVLPQDLRDNSDLPTSHPTTAFIAYRTTNLITGEVEDFEREIVLVDIVDEHGDPYVHSWEQGMGITYRFTISLFDGVAVKVKTGDFMEADKWKKHEGGEANIDLN